MTKRRWVGVTAVIILLLLLIGPLVYPIPPLPAGNEAAALAGTDSEFLQVDGLALHAVRTPPQPDAAGPLIVLLHGTGLSTYSWRFVQEPLAAFGEVLAIDTPGFGLTERPLPPNLPSPNPYSLEGRVDLLRALLDAEGVEQAILIGNSAGGQWAAKFALEHPERVAGLVLVDAAVLQGGGTPDFVRPLLTTPQLTRMGPFLLRQNNPWGEDFLRGLWMQPEALSAEDVAVYQAQLRVGVWDAALWQIMVQSRPLTGDERAALVGLAVPTLVVNGAADTLVPPEVSAELAERLPNGSLALLPACGHLPQEECPAAFMAAVGAFLEDIP